jgi:hypothetical protein
LRVYQHALSVAPNAHPAGLVTTTAIELVLGDA